MTKQQIKTVRMVVIILSLLIAATLPFARPYIARASSPIIVTTTTDEDSGVLPGAGCSLYEAEKAIVASAAYGGCPAPDASNNVIQLPSGTYTQTMAFELDAATAPAAAGVTIQGNGSSVTTLELESSSPNSQSSSIYLKSDNAALKNMTVTGKVVLRIDGNGTTVSDLTMRSQGALNPFYGAALDIEGNNANLVNVNLIYDNPVGDGGVRPYIYVGGDHATVNGITVDGTANANNLQTNGFETYKGHYDNISNVTTNNTYGGLTLDGSFMTIDHVTVTNTSSDGIGLYGNDSHLSNLSVTNITGGNGIGAYANDNYPGDGSGTTFQHVIVSNGVRDGIDLYDDFGYVHLLKPTLDDVQVSNISNGDGIGLYTSGVQSFSNIQVTNASHDNISLYTSQNVPSTVTLNNIKLDQAGQQSLYAGMYQADSISINNLTAINSRGSTWNYSTEVDSAGTVAITNSIISDSPTSGGLALYGTCPSVASVTDTYIANNLGASGIYSTCYTLSLNRVTITNNHASDYGGGIYVESDFTANSTPHYLKMSNVTLFNNKADLNGGAVYVDDSSSGADPTVISNYSWNNVTFAGNQSPSGSTIYLRRSGQTGPYPILTNSLLAGADNQQCASDDALQAFSTGSTNNMSTDSSCLGITNIVSNPMLDNTLTTYATAAKIGYNSLVYLPVLALQAGSPAIDAANNATCSSVDERSVNRPDGNNCDIGAFEMAPNIPAIIGGVTPGAPNTGFLAPLLSFAPFVGIGLAIASVIGLAKLRACL
jgi:predicted outer membrane repeat protein